MKRKKTQKNAKEEEIGKEKREAKEKLLDQFNNLSEYSYAA